MKFSFVEQGAHAAIRYGRQEILKLDKNSHFFGGQWMARDQVMVPGGGPEVASLPTFSTYGQSGAVTDVRYVVSEIATGLKVRVIPTETKGGKAVLSQVRQEAVFRVQLDEGRFVWTQDFILEALKDIDTDGQGKQSVLGLYLYPFQSGQPGKFVQFADPQTTNASGPAVPMTRDWQEHYEPFVGPDTYRLHWKRDYVSIIFQNPDGSFWWSELNKTKWSNLTLDNRRARPCHAKGLLYLVKENGDALEYRCNAPSHYHHVCEWGMDFHFWYDLGPFLRKGILRAGTKIVASTTGRLVGKSVISPVMAKAKLIELTPRERANADRPAYEEPENTFTVSVLDRLDAQFWTATSEGCAWKRDGGYKKGSGCLVIRNSYSNTGEWQQTKLGPSQWGNPFMPGLRYKLSAWVKLEDFQPDSSWGGPQLGIELYQYNGPASSSPPTTVDGGWSRGMCSGREPLQERFDWTHIQVITPPFPSYVLRACLFLRLTGRGTACFSNVRWELAETD